MEFLISSHLLIGKGEGMGNGKRSLKKGREVKRGKIKGKVKVMKTKERE